jgi:TRAP-type mannitol/chloroaromatic compound transport system substrate-binding protein
MKASLKATKETMDEEAAKNANFKKIYEHYTRFQEQQNKWYSVAEQRMQNFQIAALNASAKRD